MRDISPEICKLAPVILAEIEKASSILLHCHPKPDPDSVGSALAMKFALEHMGKKTTVMRGDSEMPRAFEHFPGVKDISPTGLSGLDLGRFDLFISLDSSSVQMISRDGSFSRDSIRTIVIDHHKSNERYGHINLTVTGYPATAQILFDLFVEWGIEITPDIASDLFIGIYTDTGGLKYMGADAHTYEIMAKLVGLGANPFTMIDPLDSSDAPGTIAFIAAALGSVETFLGGKVAVSCVSHDALSDRGITESDIGGVQLAGILRRVVGWDLAVGIIEMKPLEIKLTFRTRDMARYDVSKIAVAFGGGGHVGAAGAFIVGKTVKEAKDLVVAKAKELYKL